MLQTIPWDTLGPSGLLAILILAIITGRLIPRRTVEEWRKADRLAVEQAREDRDRAIEDARHDRDEWRAAHRVSETARVVLADQINAIVEFFRPSLKSMSRDDSEDARS